MSSNVKCYQTSNVIECKFHQMSNAARAPQAQRLMFARSSTADYPSMLFVTLIVGLLVCYMQTTLCCYLHLWLFSPAAPATGSKCSWWGQWQEPRRQEREGPRAVDQPDRVSRQRCSWFHGLMCDLHIPQLFEPRLLSLVLPLSWFCSTNEAPSYGYLPIVGSAWQNQYYSLLL